MGEQGEKEKTDVLRKKTSFPAKTGDGTGFPDFLGTSKIVLYFYFYNSYFYLIIFIFVSFIYDLHLDF